MSTRGRKDVVQARPCGELLEKSIARYQNRAIETAQIIEELIALARDMRQAQQRGEQLGLTDDEVAFYDVLDPLRQHPGTVPQLLACLGLGQVVGPFSGKWFRRPMSVHSEPSPTTE